MSQDKHTSTYLGLLWHKDRPMAIVIAGMLLLYLLIHVVKIEIYPLYLYAMYSQDLERSTYDIPHLSSDEVSLDHLMYDTDTRHGVYLSNTINGYIDIVSHQGIHPETSLMTKVSRAAGMEYGIIHQILIRNHAYDTHGLHITMQEWLQQYTGSPSVSVSTRTYVWKQGRPVLTHSNPIYD